MGKDLTEKTRVQFVISTLEVGGAERQLTALATRIDRTKFDVEVLVLTRGGRFETELNQAGIPYKILDKGPGMNAKCFFKTVREMRRFRPHVVHGWLFTGSAYGRAAGTVARVPVRIASERSVSRWREGIHKWTDRALSKCTEIILCNSNAVADWVKDYAHLKDQRVEVIANGLEAEAFAIKDYGQVNQPPRLITVCRMTLAKRLDILLQAVHQLQQEGLAFHLDMVGDGELRSQVEQQISDLGIEAHVTCHGSQKDVVSYLTGADIFVLSSDREGLPNAVMEAMACGLPVVATRAGGTPDLVHPQNGFLVDCQDIEGLTNGMRELLLNAELRQTMGEAGRTLIEKEFSMEAMVRKHEVLYRDALETTR